MKNTNFSYSSGSSPFYSSSNKSYHPDQVPYVPEGITIQYHRPEDNPNNEFQKGIMENQPRTSYDLFASQASTTSRNSQKVDRLRSTTANLSGIIKKFDFNEDFTSPTSKYSNKLAVDDNTPLKQAEFRRKDRTYSTIIPSESSSTSRSPLDSSQYKTSEKKYPSSKSKDPQAIARHAKLDEMIKNIQREKQLKEQIRRLRQEKQSRNRLSKNTASFSQSSLLNSKETYTPKRQSDSKYDFKKKHDSDSKVSEWKMEKDSRSSVYQSKPTQHNFKLSDYLTNSSKHLPSSSATTTTNDAFSKKKTQDKKKPDSFSKYFGGEKQKVQKFDCKVGLRDFQLGKLLGQGKFGNVYKALHKSTKSLYALKKVPKSLIQSHYMQDQFILQIKLQAYMNHENILSLDGFFHDQQHIYLILEYMEEGTLYSMLKKTKTLGLEDTAKKIKQISKGVIYMHETGLAHRDIKPENIVMSHGVCKLCDFGWSTICDERRKTYCGTFDYAAPEILEGNEYDMSVDLWCLGVLAYELLVGKAPFYHIKKEETKKKILNVGIQKITYPSSLPREAVDFIDRLLKKDPEQRIKVQQLLSHPFLANA